MNRAIALVVSAAMFLLAACGETSAQRKPVAHPVSGPSVVATSRPPEPPDPAPVVEGDNITTASVRGMTIIVKRVFGAEFGVAQLYVKGGVRNWTMDNQGIEDIALRVAASGGTRTLSKDDLSKKLASLGATIDANPSADFSVLQAKAPTEAWDETFALLVDVFKQPALPASELEIARQRALSELRHEMENGDGRLWLLARRGLFTNHPYLSRSIGTIETVSAIKAEDLTAYLAKLREMSRLVFVAVGDIDAERVIDQIKKAFEDIPRGAFAQTPIPPLHFETGKLAGEEMKLPTNYVQSTFAGPTWNDPDFVPTWLAMQVMGHRVWEEVRTKRNLSYAPGAYLSTRTAAPYGVLYVTAVDPNATMKVMHDEVRRIQSELVPESELSGAKSVFLTQYALEHETTEWQAWVLGQSLLYAGDIHVAATIPDRFRAATAENVRAAAKKWMTNFQTAIVGDPTKLDPAIVGAK
jgi:zinc protease